MLERLVPTIQEEIRNWLHEQQNWLQEAALRILLKGGVQATDVVEVAVYLKDAEGSQTSKTRAFPGFSGDDAITSQVLRLDSIGPISGVDNLAPRNPLSMGQGNLVVVYGNNGTGKSGYTRILKRCCGKPNAAELRPNVFRAGGSERSVTIGFTLDGSASVVEWNPAGPAIPELLPIDIFDAGTARIYLDGETEATYTPAAVALFEDLVTFCDKVRGILEAEQGRLVSRLPSIPAQFADTQVGRLYQGLRPTHTAYNLAPILTWGESEIAALSALEERLKADDPAALAKTKRGAKAQLDKLIATISDAAASLNQEAIAIHHALKEDFRQKRSVALDGARALRSVSSFEGVGGETWRALWEAAREYSVGAAYPGIPFPNSKDGSKCVLCHQTLDDETQTRLQSFEEFVKGAIELSATAAEQKWSARLKSLPEKPTTETLRTACLASGLPEESWLSHLQKLWDAIELIVNNVADPVTNETEALASDDLSILVDLNALSQKLASEADQLDEDAKKFDRDTTTKSAVEFRAREWTAQQADAIKVELERLKSAASYENWKRWTNTTAISRKAGVIAEALITEAYVSRFNEELARLGAGHIKVELVKSRTQRGRTKHRIQLKGVVIAGVSPAHILSEGEHRIVALAAFLADASANQRSAPFIFDDPISSLDQPYEEKTIARLVELSTSRQVIVFTHRLSFLGIMVGQSNPEQIFLRAESWGTGEPGVIPLFAKKPENALADLKNRRLSQASKALRDDGGDAYYPMAKAICSDFRILMERIVEVVLLAEVVQRHRRDVQTMNRIRSLAKITVEDCILIEEMMTKYSAFEHSQSDENPVALPLPNDLGADIDRVLAWHSEFKNR